MTSLADKLSMLKQHKGQLELQIETTYATIKTDFSGLHSLQRKLAETIKEIRRIEHGAK